MNFNPLRNEQDPDSQKKKEIYRFQLLFRFITFLGDLLQGICFYFFFASSFTVNTEFPENYGSKQCIVLLTWGKAAAFYLTTGFIIFCIVNPILTCAIPSIRNCFATAPEWIFQNILYYIRLIMYVWGGIIFLGLMVSLGYNENCGDLASGTGFFIFVVLVTLIIIGLCYCFVLKEDETTTYQSPEQQKPEKVQDYGTMQNQKDNLEQQQGDQKISIAAENQEQEQKQQQQQLQQEQQEIDDPDKRVEKPKEEINELQ